MQTGENEQALRKIIDFTRLFSLAVLIIHFYLSCYPLMQQLNITRAIVDRLMFNIAKLPLFKTSLIAKLSALGLLIISLVGSKGKKDERSGHAPLALT